MHGLLSESQNSQHKKLQEFLNFWSLDRIQTMELEDYTNVGSQNTFCYWLEFETEILGRIGGKPSNKFGIWKRKSNDPITSKSFLYDDDYAWYKKYGNNSKKHLTLLKE